ncbi:MAG: hypothetical protein WED34_18670 [Planctomycetales bacterium]
MKRSLTMLTVAAVLGAATAAPAADWSLFRAPGQLQTVQLQPTPAPAPDPLYIGPSGPVPMAPGSYPVPGQPGPMGAYGPVEPYPAQGVPLYHNVKYEDLDNVHPCAITRIVMVPDPCADPCYGCGPQCVAVQICVPPCACERVKTSKDGRKIKYDYGKYEVEIEVKRGYIKVDYDD